MFLAVTIQRGNLPEIQGEINLNHVIFVTKTKNPDLIEIFTNLEKDNYFKFFAKKEDYKLRRGLYEHPTIRGLF